MQLSTFLFALLAGVVGAWVMNRVLVILAKSFGKKADMILALGTFFGKKAKSARVLGTIIHLTSGALFGLLYFIGFSLLGITQLPGTFLLGLGFGFIHGLIAAYAFMILFASKHDDADFRRENIPVGALNWLAHVIYGGIFGLLIAFA